MGTKAKKSDGFDALLSQKVSQIQEQAEGRSTKNGAMALIRNKAFLDGLTDLMEANPFPKAQTVKAKKPKKTQRILNLMLSDLHYGSDVEEAETGTQYGPVEEARRTAAVVQATCEWKRQYRAETELYVHLIGDIIEGKLHDPESAAPLTEQFFRAVWILGQAVRHLGSEFKQVTVFCSPGNHGRIKSRHPGRAVNQKWDSFENMIYGALKIQFKDSKNIKFVMPLTPYYRYKAFDKQGFMTHGDTVLNVGYPGKAINVENVRKQVNEINAKDHCDLFGAGHVHVASSVRLPTGPTLITNGCLVPSGEFGQSIGSMNNVCCQQVWESVPGIIYGHRMEIIVDEKTDANSSLDQIIAPYPGTNAFGTSGTKSKSKR